jgi:hypothetical protein
MVAEQGHADVAQRRLHAEGERHGSNADDKRPEGHRCAPGPGEQMAETKARRGRQAGSQERRARNAGEAPV